MKGLIVSQDPSNADTPRAHITNMAAIGMDNLNVPLRGTGARDLLREC